MALRKIISKVVFPELERDLGRSIATELQSAHSMVDNMLAPAVFVYTSQNVASGAFQPSQRLEGPIVTKIQLEPSKDGLFADRESWH